MEKDLEARTKRFALSVIRFFFFLAPNSGGGCLGASTSSSPERSCRNAQELLKESSELLAIFASIGKKLKE